MNKIEQLLQKLLNTIKQLDLSLIGTLIIGTSKYDADNNRLGIGTTTPTYKLDVRETKYFTDVVYTSVSAQDDFLLEGTFYGSYETEFEVEIDGTTPDTYSITVDGVSISTGNAITAQVQDNPFFGVYFTFDADTGHSVGDKWTFSGIAGGSINFNGALYDSGSVVLYSNTTTNNTVVGKDNNVGVGVANTILGNEHAELLSTGQDNVIIGTSGLSALTSGSGNIAIGTNVGTTNNNSNNILIGYQADTSTSGTYSSVVIGKNAVGATQSVAIGESATAAAEAIAIGAGTNATANTYVSGGTGLEISTVYFGNGITNASPSAVTYTGSGGSGTDIAGATVNIAGGKGTGSGIGGSVIIQTSAAGASGTTLRSLTNKLSIDGNGNIRAYTLHNNTTAEGNASNQDIRSGTYTPTASGGTNVDSLPTTTIAQWMRVGNVVTVSGQFTADPTASGATNFEMSTPVTTGFTLAYQAGGVAFCAGIAGLGAEITGRAGTSNVRVQWTAVDLASQTFSYSYTFLVK